MASHALHLASPRPFFAELPYYLWGQVNYDSDGDCEAPTDRSWTWLELTHRDTREQLRLHGEGDAWTVEGPELAASRAVHFLIHRCVAVPAAGSALALGAGWDHERAAARAARVAAVFERPELTPFGRDHLFWGSWKWIGWFGTEFTWVGRWIMEALLAGDARGVHLCAYWLREGALEGQDIALRGALERLTGLSFPTDEAWVSWYHDGPGEAQYPEPDFEQWKRDLEARYPELA